jgi:KRAB domain-containing zinc finger protein
MKSANLKVPFQCTKCPKHYWTKYFLKAHMKSSHGEVKRYQCYFCSLATSEKSNLFQHMPKHTMEKPFKCQYCFQSFKWQRSLTMHQDNKSCHLKQTYPSLSPCYFCGKAFSTHLDLKVHMKRVHLKESSRLCNLCCKYFSSTSAINHHIRTVHLLERNHKCQLCLTKFGSTEDLNRHTQRVHTKEKPYNCYFCSKSFVTLEHLKRHIWIHTREKPLTCYFCQKDFSHPVDLSAHIRRIHTKERPFQCIQCPSRSYLTKGALTVHVQIKHGNGFHH